MSLYSGGIACYIINDFNTIMNNKRNFVQLKKKYRMSNFKNVLLVE